MDYNGERFLNVLYKELYKSEEVLHTKEKNDTKEKSIKRYMDRLESIHSKANTQSKKDLIKSLYFKKYIAKKENLPNNLSEADKEEKIANQRISLSAWIDYLTDENAKYPMWAKYWVFQQALKMGTYDEINNKYTRRTKSTVNPFVEANPEIIAKAIGNVVELLNNDKLTKQEVKNIISNISFEKLYIEYQKNRKKQYKTNEGIWIKYNQGSVEDAKKLSASLKDRNTGWCTAYESTAIHQVCGDKYDEGGDFYVFYTKDEEGNYNIPRIAIRLDGHRDIGEIRGVDEHQSLEEEMVLVLEKKLKEMTFLKNKDVKENLDKISKLKELLLIKNKTLNGINLTRQEIIDLYTSNFGFGWGRDCWVDRIIQRRDFIEDYNYPGISSYDKSMFILRNINLLDKLKLGRFIDDKITIEVLSKNDKSILKYVKEEILSDKQFVLKLLKHNSDILMYVDEKLKDNIIFMLDIIRKRPMLLCDASKRLKDAKEVVLAAIDKNPCALKSASDRLKDNKELVLLCVKKNGLVLDYASERLQNDKEVVLEAVKNNADSIRYCSEELENDLDINLVAIKTFPSRILKIDKKLLKDRKFMLNAIKINYETFSYADKVLLNDKTFVIDAIKIDYRVFNLLGLKFRRNREVVLEAIRRHESLFNIADYNLQNNMKFVTKITKDNPKMIKYISSNLFNNKKFIYKLVKQNPKVGFYYMIRKVNPKNRR